VDALIPTLSNEAFAEEAERQGNAYTLDGFLDEYNEGNINVECMCSAALRILSIRALFQIIKHIK
jgi:hypothetical protein